MVSVRAEDRIRMQTANWRSSPLPPSTSAPWFRSLRARLRLLYHGRSAISLRFRLTVIVIDIAIIAFFVAAPLLRESEGFLLLDYGIAAILALELAARALAWPNFSGWIKRPIVWVDLFVLATLLFPQLLFNLGFLRALRLWTLVNSDFFWETVGSRYDNSRVEEIVKALGTLITFVFVATGFVYTSFAYRFDGMSGYIDALYFTITSLTTTGYGDILLPGTWGRILSILIMLVGVSLFLRLVQALFRPYKVRWPCPSCGLQRHDPDAVHCKACGVILSIPDDGRF